MTTGITPDLWQAFLARLFFDSWMSALAIIVEAEFTKCRIVYPLVGNMS